MGLKISEFSEIGIEVKPLYTVPFIVRQSGRCGAHQPSGRPTEGKGRDRCGGRKESLVEEFDIPNLPCLQSILKETLQLHPTGPLIIYQLSKDCEVGWYDILAKMTLFVNVWAIGRYPSHWSGPLEFRSERFTKSAIGVRGHDYHMLPLGSQRRGYRGIQPALAAMIQCFE